MKIKLKCSEYSKQFNIKEGIKNVFDFSIGSAMTELIRVEKSIEMRAFLLLFNTFKKTNLELKKKLGQHKLNKATNTIVISTEFEIEFNNYFEQEITITKDFFSNVIKHNPEYLIKSFELFKRNLIALDIQIPDNFEFDYYVAFRNNLQEEFQEDKESYSELIDYFDNPIYEQNKSFDRQLNYYSYIKKLYTNPLQPDDDRKESLKDLYIEPFYRIYKNNTDIKKNESDEFTHDGFEFPNDSISIHSFLNDYFLKGIQHNDLKANYNMLFLLGQPGQGKTSFCYKLIYDYLNIHNGLPLVPIYFIKIRDLIAKDFIDSTFNTINKHLGQNIKFDEDDCILLLDGLDEAYMAGGLNDNDLKILYDRLNKTAQQNKKLKIILTSRLNYLKVNDTCIDGSLVFQLSILTDQQIFDYAKKFKIFYPENKFLKKIDTVVNEKKYFHIKELLQQAVIIYFIAIADIDIEEKDSRSNIYDKIFDSLAKRSWDKQKGQLDYIKPKVKEHYKLYVKYLRSYIRNIAFEIYQSPNLYITLDKLTDLESTKTFIKRCFNEDLFTSKDDIKEINKYLLISFYFQESNNNKTTETAIEFFHNSLWEYLTAEYMWEENKKMLLKKDTDDDDEFENISKEKYFKFLNYLIGNKELSYQVKNNIIDIIKNEDFGIKKDIFNQSKKNFFKLAEDDFLLEYSRNNNYLSVFEKASEIFELFWTFIYYSKEDLNYKIETNPKINLFLLSLKDFISHNELKQIKFSSPFDNYLESIVNSTLDDVEFFNFYSLKYLISTKFINCTFEICGFDLSIIRSNEFKDVKFENCEFNEGIKFNGNKIFNCKFINCEVPGIDWFNIFCQENEVDETTKNSHNVEQEIEQNYAGNKEVKFYIRIIDNDIDLPF